MHLRRNLRPRTGPLLAIAAAVLSALAAPARAEDLLQVYEAARAYDATFLAARAQADSAVHRTAQANALYLPTVGIEGSYRQDALESGTSLANPAGDRLKATTSAATVSARQPLFNMANSATYDQAQKDLEIARNNLITAEQDLIVRVATAYFEVLGAQDTLFFVRGNKASIAEQLASAKRNFEVGTATITDAREAQARYDLATAQEIASENDLRNRRIVLDQLVGRVNVQPNPLLPEKLQPVLPSDPDRWVSDAWAQHPAVQRALLRVDIAKLETSKAKAGHLPTVDLVANVGSQHADGRLANIPGSSNNGSVGVQLNLPLFAGFAVQNRVKETLSLEERAANELDASRRDVATATRQAFYTMRSSEAQVKALEAAEASGKLALEATQLGYRVGVRVNIDVLNAQTQLYQTQRDLARARYELLLGDLRLRLAAGLLMPADLIATNAALAK